ncbi:MAG TPA: DUF4340 domain-containing protein [Candidatus Enterenecus stercoripullorum]|nr:DUF4340 domain-containing protein [Candidatus Enterenecus stercoripullorum]
MPFVLKIGDYDGAYCYARIAGSQMVYYIDNTGADAMIYPSLDSLLPDDSLLLDYDTVNSMDITLDGETYHVEKVTEETTDEDGNTTQVTVWTLNGAEIDLQPVLTDLTSLTSTGSQSGLTPDRSMSGQSGRFVKHIDILLDTAPPRLVRWEGGASSTI